MTVEKELEKDIEKVEFKITRKPFVKLSEEELNNIRIEDWLTCVESTGKCFVIIGGVRFPGSVEKQEDERV